MARIIKSFEKMSPELKALYDARFPEGPSGDDYILIRNLTGELIPVIQFEDDEHVYLVKKPVIVKEDVEADGIVAEVSPEDDGDDSEFTNIELDGSGADEIGEDDPNMDF